MSRFQRSALFVAGELTRRVQTELREAKGEAISADAMVVEIIRAKRLDMGDGGLRVQISGLILRVLGRMLAKGAVRKDGWGADARWVQFDLVQTRLNQYMEAMSFIEREIDRLRSEILRASDGNRRAEFYTAQQALSWASEPTVYRSPVVILTGTPGEPEDCQAERRRHQF
ncbi:MAG: hypothetical protein J0H67_18595 [Rhodospirillales bacterium]|nr:hypothetical protein [Rhodospirillales bacterium]